MTSFHSFELGRAHPNPTEAAGPLAVDSPANSWIDYFSIAPCDFFRGVISLKSANSAIIGDRPIYPANIAYLIYYYKYLDTDFFEKFLVFLNF